MEVINWALFFVNKHIQKPVATPKQSFSKLQHPACIFKTKTEHTFHQQQKVALEFKFMTSIVKKGSGHKLLSTGQSLEVSLEFTTWPEFTLAANTWGNGDDIYLKDRYLLEQFARCEGNSPNEVKQEA